MVPVPAQMSSMPRNWSTRPLARSWTTPSMTWPLCNYLNSRVGDWDVGLWVGAGYRPQAMQSLLWFCLLGTRSPAFIFKALVLVTCWLKLGGIYYWTGCRILNYTTFLCFLVTVLSFFFFNLRQFIYVLFSFGAIPAYAQSYSWLSAQKSSLASSDSDARNRTWATYKANALPLGYLSGP